jgi:DNA-binding MarR family transcriptional regulator
MMTCYDDVGFLKTGKYRIPILNLLAKSNYIPNEIAKKICVNPSEVSRTLSQLEERGLIKCKTPERKKGRIYTITSKGNLVLSSLGKIGGEYLR